MSTGAIIFAFDSEIQYTKLAIECAKRVKHYLDIPITLFTDKEFEHEIFDQIVEVERPKEGNKRFFHDREESTTWLNFGRNTAFEYTPYNRTLLLDCDYMIESSVLASALESEQPFLCHRAVKSVHETGKRIQTFGTKNTQLWWATVVVFDKSKFSENIFTAWKMIETHYQHYSNLFGFSRSQFRNDFALSLALLMCNGHSYPDQCELPWPLVNVDTDIKLDKDENGWWIHYTKSEKGQHHAKKILVRNQDLHVMCKSYLEKIYAV